MFRLLLVLVAATLVGCASVSTERVKPDYAAADDLTFPAYDGLRTRIQVIRFGIPRDITDQYPKLAEQRVGFGLHNRIIEGFFDTGRFEFIEEKQAMLDRMANQWKLSMAGLVSEGTEVEAGQLRAPQYLVYAEVYDFAVTTSEEVRGVRSEVTNATIMGLQVRLVDVESGEFIVGSGEGEASSAAVGAWASPELEFDQSTVGIATERAMKVALINVIRRMEERGWSAS